MINTELNDLMILQFDLFIGLRHFRILCVCVASINSLHNWFHAKLSNIEATSQGFKLIMLCIYR